MNTNAVTRVIVESFPQASTSLIEFLSGLLTPVIALIAVYVAYQQYRIQRLKFRHETYERRLGVYRTVQAFLSEVMREGDVPFHRTGQFYADASEATFLFHPEIQEFIDELHSKAVDMHALYERLYPSGGSDGLPVGEERSKVADENGEIFKWIVNQMPQSKELFRRHMSLAMDSPTNAWIRALKGRRRRRPSSAGLE